MKKGKFKKDQITDLLLMVGGGVVASKVSNIKLPIALPAPVQSALPLVLGVFLGTKKGAVGNIGKGMAVVGGMKLIAGLVPQLGLGNSPFIDDQGQGGGFLIEGSDYALAGAGMDAAPVGNTSYALAGVDRKDSDIFG